jgi:hypothetical protein
LFTASRSWNAGTTAPEGSTSIFRRLPAMSLTFLAKSCAYSWKMSLVGQVLWKRIVAVWARLMDGAASAPVATAAVEAALRNLRRRGALSARLMGSPELFG